MTEKSSNGRRQFALEDFPVHLTLPVLWGDQDLYGHVNNTIHIRWLESSRVAYWDQAGMADLMEGQQWGPILVRVSCDYKRQIRYPDIVQVGGRITEVRGSSLTMEHAIFNQSRDNEVAAIGESVVVLFDYDKQTPLRIPDAMRQQIEALESGCGPVDS